MDFIKLAEDAYSDPKFLAVGAEGFTLYVKALCYSKKHLLDGFVPADALPLVGIGVRNPAATARLLVAKDLWESADGGYRVSPERWARWQRTKEQVEERREHWRDKKARQRKGKKSDAPARSPARSPEVSPGDNDETNEEIPQVSPATVPITESREQRAEYIPPSGGGGTPPGSIPLGAGWEPLGDWLEHPGLRADLAALERRRSPDVFQANRTKVEATRAALDANGVGVEGLVAVLRRPEAAGWRGLEPQGVIRVWRLVQAETRGSRDPDAIPPGVAAPRPATEAELAAAEEMVGR